MATEALVAGIPQTSRRPTPKQSDFPLSFRPLAYSGDSRGVLLLCWSEKYTALPFVFLPSDACLKRIQLSLATLQISAIQTARAWRSEFHDEQSETSSKIPHRRSLCLLHSSFSFHRSRISGTSVISLDPADQNNQQTEPVVDMTLNIFLNRSILKKQWVGLSGTGPGFTVIWNTVNDHRGRLTVESCEAGTTFARCSRQLKM